MLTMHRANQLFRNILEKANLDTELENDIQLLINDFKERDSFLSKAGEVKDDEGMDTYEYLLKQSGGDSTEWEKKYTELKSQYIDRFFNGDVNTYNKEETGSGGTHVGQEDTPPDEPETFDELLNKEVV